MKWLWLIAGIMGLFNPAFPVEKFNTSSKFQKHFQYFSRKEVNQFLETLQREGVQFEDRIRVIATARLGTPFEWQAIGEGSGIEPAPIFRIDRTNCTAFILTTMALASAQSFHQAESLMTYLNYYPLPAGQNPVSYHNRIHFTSDRLLTSPYFEIITNAIAEPTMLDTARVILNRQEDGTHFLPLDWEKEVELAYIPRTHITPALLQRLPAVCGVAVVQKELFKNGIIIGHEGILLDGKDFIHSSKYTRRVVREDFYRYTRKRKKYVLTPVCDGIVLYQMKPVTPVHSLSVQPQKP
ncbi:MAG: DUF1460 domain-containing protein [candidate division KSB1 bacterium]|nr:DUF1460 domain-containing protein [candidate division KSB1 bacterium]MDZ7317905.1 DUF1460 domain-containing protein [candidate division KSB1 bacterium]MDZ7339887.1 DUF1460 domain-containing protein [candidate division KSB1 bacterium]